MYKILAFFLLSTLACSVDAGSTLDAGMPLASDGAVADAVAVFAPVYHARPSIYVESTNGTQVAVYAASLTVKDSVTGEHVYIEQVGRTVSTTWPTSAWRYLYLVSTNGVASVEVSSTAPASAIAGPLFKSGDETRRYLCSVRCNAGGTVDQFWMRNGVYHWIKDDERYIVGSGAGGAAGSTSWTNVSVSTQCPAHARAINVLSRIINTDTANISELLIRQGGASLTDPVSTVAVGTANSGGANIGQDHLLIPLFGATSIDWANLAATSITVVIRAEGWEE